MNVGSSSIDAITKIQENIDTLWVLIAAALVFLMQAGFAALESGVTRSKNTINVALKNIMDFIASTFIYWCVGFGLMFGESISGFVGASKFFLLRPILKNTHFLFFR